MAAFLSFLFIVFVSALAAFLSSMSGGGSSIISIPSYMMMGIFFPAALAAHQISSLFWLLPAAYNYLKGRKIEWRFIFIYTFLGLIGAYVGAVLVSQVNEAILRPFIGVLILLLVIWMWFRKDVGITDKSVKKDGRRRIWMLLTAPFLGFYESIFSSGNGIIFTGLMVRLRQTDLMKSLGYYYIISFVWVGVAVAVLVTHGFFSFELALGAIVGGVFGGFSGSKLGRLKGNKFIKAVFACMGTLLAIKLMFFG